MKYNQYLFGEILKSKNKMINEVEYDLQFSLILQEYEKFSSSSFNNDNKGLSECIMDYLNDTKIIFNTEDPLTTIEEINHKPFIPTIVKSENIIKDTDKNAKRYNKGKTEWTLLDFEALESLPKVLMYGRSKYDLDNWKKHTDNKTILDSAFRHLIKLQEGELYDKESGLEHAGHIMANMLFFNYHNKRKKS